jgi:hypothetical protein
MHAAFRAKLQFVLASYPAYCSAEMMRFLAPPDNAEGLAPDGCVVSAAYVDFRKAMEASVQVGRKSDLSEHGVNIRDFTADTLRSIVGAQTTVGNSQNKRGAKRVRVIDRQQVTRGGAGAGRARIGGILETIETKRAAALL